MAQEVEHILGKDEVTSSSLVSSSTKKHDGLSCFFNVCKLILHTFARFISKIARGACRLRSAIENTSCSHRLLLPSEISRQPPRHHGVPFCVCVPHTLAKNLQAGSSPAFEASSCQQFQPLHLSSVSSQKTRRFVLFFN